MQIRPIVPDDNPVIEGIVRAVSAEFGTAGEGGPTADAELGDMHSAYAGEGSRYFVALRGGTIRGGAGVAPLRGADADTCELQKMYLLAESRGLGLGRALLEACFAFAREAGYRRLYLETTAKMTGARRLYERAGCVPIDEALGCTGHHRCDARYVKELDG